MMNEDQCAPAPPLQQTMTRKGLTLLFLFVICTVPLTQLWKALQTQKCAHIVAWAYFIFLCAKMA